MYEINLDFDPVTVGFDPREITKNDDGTYTVTRRFVHCHHNHNVGNAYYDVEAYCPCYTDNVEIYCYQYMDYKGRIYYGSNYVTNDGPHQTYESKNWNNRTCDYFHPICRFNRMYDTHIEDSEQEKSAAFCVSCVNRSPNEMDSQRIKQYFKDYHIVYGKNASAPSSPQEDPFLPEEFKKMLNGEK